MPKKYKWSIRGVFNRMPFGGVAQLVCIATSFVCLLTFVIYYFGGVKLDYVVLSSIIYCKRDLKETVNTTVFSKVCRLLPDQGNGALFLTPDMVWFTSICFNKQIEISIWSIPAQSRLVANFIGNCIQG